MPDEVKTGCTLLCRLRLPVNPKPAAVTEGILLIQPWRNS